jgi:hypothetical protein
VNLFAEIALSPGTCTHNSIAAPSDVASVRTALPKMQTGNLLHSMGRPALAPSLLGLVLLQAPADMLSWLILWAHIHPLHHQHLALRRKRCLFLFYCFQFHKLSALSDTRQAPKT